MSFVEFECFCIQQNFNSNLYYKSVSAIQKNLFDALFVLHYVKYSATPFSSDVNHNLHFMKTVFYERKMFSIQKQKSYNKGRIICLDNFRKWNMEYNVAEKRIKKESSVI